MNTNQIETAQILVKYLFDGVEYKPGISYYDGHLKPVADQTQRRIAKYVRNITVLSKYLPYPTLLELDI